ncbi:MAG: acetylglutamate kinase [Armatimonadota bacterium]
MSKLQLNNGFHERVGTLTEALPYIRKWSGKTVVVKYGGAAMTDPGLQRSVMKDLVLLHYVGVRVVLVHGGGKAISAMMEKLGEEPEFVGGLRVTGASTMEIVQMVLVGSVGQQLVSLLNAEGGRAVSLSGKDANMIVACKKECPEGDLGYVGQVESIDTAAISCLTENGYIVCLAPVGVGPDARSYNINADTVASAVAAKLGAEKLVLLTDVKGIMKDVDDPDTLISSATLEQARTLLEDGTVAGGMIPKVEACIEAVEQGVSRAHLIDGRMEHSLLMELFTERGVGSMIVAGKDNSNDQ